MSEGRDPAIKLFGRKIPLQEEQTPMEVGDAAYSAPEMEPPSEEEKDTCQGKANIEALNPSVLNNSAEVAKEISTETAKAAEEAQPEHDHKESGISDQDKVLKKPDKVLPCPRCNSMDTKFCYYNNYNVNQPRHFCKNCQRYWTAGGSMRNVPVGAGRRKNKHTASGYRHTSIAPDALASVQLDGPDSIDRRSSSPFKCNATILKFGPDAPLCESMASMLDIGEQNLTSQLDFTASAENREDNTSCSSACKPEENNFYEDSMMPHLQYFPGSPWANPWWNNFAAAAAMAASGCSPVQENQPPLITTPAFCHPPLPFPFIPPPPFWGWSCGPWHLPWSGNSNGASPSSSTTTSYCTLGKHSREEKTEKSLWIPKTLRIDDPDEAAKSSIFATLGIKPYQVTKFKAFSSKSGNGKGDDASNTTTTTTQVLHANPAALSRSRSFQEITS